MTEKSGRLEIAAKKVVYTLPAMDRVAIRHDVEYGAAGADPLTMDLYYPEKRSARMAAVVLVCGYPGGGFVKFVGCEFKEMESCIGWARLIAASGMIAVTYTNREPVADLEALLRHVRANAALLEIDETRIGLWAASGNVPLALRALMQSRHELLRCAVLCYGYMLDLDASTGVADAAATFRFVDAAAGASVDDLPRDMPLFVARAGRDEMPRLNEGLDRFVAHALARNLPISLVNHPTGAHAFDLHDDSQTTRNVIEQILAFLRGRLLNRWAANASVPD